MSESTGLFYQLLPWNYVTKFGGGGVVIQKDGILQRTFAYRAPDIDSCDALEVNTLAVRVNDFTKRLGTGWAFHIEAQRFQVREYEKSDFDRLAPQLIDRERDGHFNSSGQHFDSSYYLTISWKPPSENVKKLTDMFIKSGSNEDGGTIKQNVEFFVNESDSVISLLANEMIIAPLNNEGTVSYLHSTISFNRHPIRFPHTRIMLDRILPDSVLDNSIPMKLGDYYIPIVSINDFPDMSYPAMLDSLNRARIEYRWVTRFICLDKEEGIKEAQKKQKHHIGSKKSFLQTAKEATGASDSSQVTNKGADIKEQDAELAVAEIDNDLASLGFLTTSVMVWDKDLTIAKKKADLVKTIINSKGFTCKNEDYNGLESFQAMMPGQIYANYRALAVMSDTMSHILPLSSVWAGQRYNEHASDVTGVGTPHVICSTLEGTPFFLSLNVGDVGHTAIWGPNGAGKSTLLNLLTMQFLKYPGSQVIIFDKGKSCRQPCLAAGGLFFEPAGENASGVNFQPLRDLETDTDLQNAMDFIEACFTVNNYTVSPPLRSAIKESLEHMQGMPKENRNITTFIGQINAPSGTPVKEMLADFIYSGKYGKIFDAEQSGLSLDSRFIAIEMEALMNKGETCIPPALIYLFNFIEKKFDGRLTLLVLDEAWLFLKNKIFADKIFEWLKVLRKKNVYVVFATQDVADVFDSPLRTTITQQCLTKIYLADPSALTDNMKNVYSHFGLTHSEISLLASATMKRDYFYTSPLGRRLFQLDLGRVTLSLIGSPDHKLLDNLEKQYEPGSPLCSNILNAKRVKYNHLTDDYSPVDPKPLPRSKPLSRSAENTESVNKLDASHEQKETNASAPPDKRTSSASPSSNISALLDAVASLPDRKQNDGSGRAAETISKEFGFSISMVYQVRKILKHGSAELIEALRNGEIQVKTAYKRISKKRLVKEEEIEGLR